MTEIALRTYTQEIKDLIDHGHFDEAIAHCQHVLETFPRHIETYRLLGKAFLEQGRHGDAADVFQRVLSAVPEDWLSHVAMAIVREDESNLDMAIWHMERAYEVNPSNPTVQQEVRRLRGRRDGVEPPKLRLTRSALARMYIKGGLYGQAIAEIRSALAEDPDRPDLQTLLASALLDSGAIQEAADICSTLLQKLPYCMEANRVLGLALLLSEKAEDAEKLFQRMESLDPYLDVEALKNEKRLSEHPVQSIVLSRLEYEGQERTVPSKQASWASSLGLKIDDQPKRQAIPDWLTAASQQPAVPAAPAAAPGAPSWIDQAAAAINAPAGTAAGAAAAGTGTGPIARTATGELPDWIQRQSPAPEPAKEETPSRQLPDWLAAAATPPETAPPAPPAQPEPAHTGDTVPEWIKTASLPPEKPQEEITGIPDWLSQPSPPSVDALPSSSLPEWARPETKTGPLEVEPNNIPDWLSSSQPANVDLGPEPEWLKQPGVETPAAESVPDWMQGVIPAESPAEIQPSTEGIPDWLREPSATASKPVDLVPEWMRGESPAAAEAPVPQAVPSADEIPEWMKPEPVEAPAPPPAAAEAVSPSMPSSPEPAAPAAAPEITLPDWMTGASPEGATPEPEPQAKAETEAAEAVPETNIPDWLQSAAPSSAAPAEAVAAEPEPVAEKPAEAVQAAEAAPTEAAEAETAPGIELPDWLKAVPAPAPPVSEEAPAPPAAEEAEAEPVPESNIPDWLKGGAPQATEGPPQVPPTAVSAPEEPPAEALAVPAEAVEAPASALKSSEPGPAHVSPTKSDGIDLPEWLVTQLEGKPKETADSSTTERPSQPLPDWLKPADGTPAPAVVDWDKAASQPVPAAPMDATRPATGISSKKPDSGAGEIPGWLDKSKPTGSDTVARWLDRRLKTSTLSSLDEAQDKSSKAPGLTPQAAAGTGSKQLPTWLDTQKPGGSDTVVRWMDKRETGSLRKPVTASFSAVSRGTLSLQGEKPSAPPVPPAPPAAPKPSTAVAAAAGIEDTVTSRKAVPPAAPPPVTAAPPPVVKPVSVEQPPEAVSRPPAQPVPAAQPAVGEEEEGEFVPPPEWLQKALGNAVAEVPPIPKKQTGGLKPGTVTAQITAAPRTVPAPVKPPPPPKPAEEPAPVPDAKTGSWVPIAPAPAKAKPKAEKPQKKAARKKTRKLTDVESEALIREARTFLETDLQKASEAYQQVIDDPASAEVVAGDLTNYLEQDPASPQLWNLLGDACSRAGRLQDAYRAYAEALRRM
jgi:tetratricopeptide (TPR) repeat protein